METHGETNELRAALEAEVRAAHDAGDLGRAASRALAGYGPEVLGFLMGLLRDETMAADAFSDFCEDLWRGLPRFGWRCSLRTWAYMLARHAASRTGKAHKAREHRQGGAASVLERVETRVRTATLPFLRTAVKSRMTVLREALPPDDQTLLILRVDKGLEWSELARVMLAQHESEPDEPRLRREAARLRKRFQLVKERLRDAAQREGLLGDGGPDGDG